MATSVNDEVVYTLPSTRALRDGDLLKLQVGITDGLVHAQQIWTYGFGVLREPDQWLVASALEALRRATGCAVEGRLVREISAAVQGAVESAGLAVDRKFVGHGIGRLPVEPPPVPCFVGGDRDGAVALEADQVLALQVIAFDGDPALRADGWNVRTVDRSRSAAFGQMVAVGRSRATVLTPPRPVSCG